MRKEGSCSGSHVSIAISHRAESSGYAYFAPAQVQYTSRVSLVNLNRLRLEHRCPQPGIILCVYRRCLFVPIGILPLLRCSDNSPYSDLPVLASGGEIFTIFGKHECPDGLPGVISILQGRGRRYPSICGFRRRATALQFLGQKHAVERLILFVMGSHLQVFGRSKVSRYKSNWIRSVNGHAVCFRFRGLIFCLRQVFFFLVSNDSAEKGDTFSIVEEEQTTGQSLVI